MSINKYIDNRSYDELVAEAKPTGAYDHVVRNILFDERNRWEHKYYTRKWEWYSIEPIEMEIEKLTKELKSLKDKVDTNRNIIDELNPNMNEYDEEYKNEDDQEYDEETEDYYSTNNDINLKKNVKKDNKKEEKQEIKKGQLSEKEIKKMILKSEKIISDSIDQIKVVEDKIVTKEKELKDLTYLEWICRSEYNSLGRATRDYRQNHDLEYLRKAVHSICSYADSLRYGSKYVAPYYKHPLAQEDSPFSEEVTWLMNRIVYENPRNSLDLDNW